jgi:CheY-like chemotaxis protein
MTQVLPKEVLVVEDEALVRMAVADALTDRGIMAWEACNSEEALHALGQHPHIGLVLTNMSMPGPMNGLELANHLHRTRPDVDLVVTSGGGLLGDADLPGNGTFVRKPYPAAGVAELVSHKLDESRAALSAD